MPLPPDQSVGGREGGDRRRKRKGIKHKKSILKEAGVLFFFFNSHPKTCPACVSEGGRGLPGLLKPLPSQAPLKLHNLQQKQILCLAPLLHFSLHQLQQQCQWLSPALWQGFSSGPSPGTQAAPLPHSPQAQHSQGQHRELPQSPGGIFVRPQTNEVQKDMQGQAVL